MQVYVNAYSRSLSLSHLPLKNRFMGVKSMEILVIFTMESYLETACLLLI